MKKIWYRIWKKHGKMKKNIFWYPQEEQEYQKRMEQNKIGFQELQSYFRSR